MRTFYFILIAATALAAWYPYALDGDSSVGLVEGLFGAPVGVATGVGLALPFLLMGLVGQAALPPARRPMLRVPLGLLLALLIALFVDGGAQVLGRPASGAVFWQLGGAIAGILIGLVPAVRGRLEKGWNDGGPAAAILLLIWILYRLFPYEFSGDTAVVAENIKPLFKILTFSLQDYVREAVAWLVVAALLARVGPERFSSLALLLFGAMLMTIEAHVVGSPLTVSDGAALLTAFLLHGLLLGWLPGRGVIYALLLLAGLGFAAMASLNLRLEPVELAWRPFTTLLAVSGGLAAGDVLYWVFVFCGLVWLLRLAGFGAIGAGAVAVIALVGLEAMRLFVEGRGPDPAGPLVALLASIALAGLRRRPWRRLRVDEALPVAAPAMAASAAAAPVVYDDAVPVQEGTVAEEPIVDDADLAELEYEPDTDDYAYEPDEVEATPNWALESDQSGGGELQYDDGGTDARYASASGYVPEEMIEEEEIEFDETAVDEEYWAEEEIPLDDGYEPPQEADDDELDYEDEYEEELDEEYEPLAEPVEEAEAEFGDKEDLIEELPEEAPAAQPLSVRDIVLALVRFVVGVGVVGAALIAAQTVFGKAAAMPAILGQASAVSLVLLALILLAVGLVAAGIGRFAGSTRWPFLTLPLLSTLAGLAFVILTGILLGDAWLEGVAGSPGIFRGILSFGFAGSFGQALVGSIPNNALFDSLELLLRGMATYMLIALPVSAFVAVFMRMSDYPQIRGIGRLLLGTIVVAVFVGSALPWLVLGKVFLFDTPSQGGLVALVDADAGAYLLLALLLLWGWNAALLSRSSEQALWRTILGRAAATILALAVGFVLAAFAFRTAGDGAGLSALLAVPGAPEWQVAAIWAGLQLVLVGILAYGCRVLPRHRPATQESEAIESD